MMNILVTGGAGFIGSNTVDRLLKNGHRVICIDNFDSFYDPEIKRTNITLATQNSNYELIEGDIRDENLLDHIFLKKDIDVVIHLAAKAGVRPSIEDPQAYLDVNVRGTLQILQSMQKHNIKKLVFASSSSIYGNNKTVPFSESDNVDYPISPYAASKKSCELLCYTYHKLYDFDIFCLRFFTVYGPRQRPEMAIHKFVSRIMDGQPISMFGNGSSERDYTYIQDIVDGVVSSVEAVKGYEIINLGESQTITLSNLIKLLENALGKKAIVEQHPFQAGDVDVTFANVSKAKQILNYNPSTSLQEGMEKFVAWKKLVLKNETAIESK